MSGGIIERAMKEWRVVTAFIFAFVAFGVVALLTMPRQEFPDFTVRQGLVVAVMPGASVSQIEEQVTRPLESYLFGFNEVNKEKTYSVTKDGQVVVFVEVHEHIAGVAAKTFWATLRHGLSEFKSQKLPAQVVALIGNNDFGDTSALLFTVEAQDRSPRDLQTYVEMLESELRQIPATAKLNRFGIQREVIRVSLSYAKLAHYSVRAASIWTSLQALGSLPLPARLDGDVLERPVHVAGVLRSERELGETIIASSPTGEHVRLKDVATLEREYGHDDAFVRHNGATAAVLSVEMQLGNDITAYGKQVDAAIERATAQLPPEVKISRIADQPKVVSAAVGHFLRDFVIAIVAVILVTMMLLPLRVASVAAVSIPISVLIAIGILHLLGMQLQTVSLAGLILVLGMVVDNAIIIVDDHVERLDHGEPPWSAAWKSARSLMLPVIIATLAIIMSYAPLPIIMDGMYSEFLGSLPATIATTLLVSLIVSAFLVPTMCAWLIRRGIRSAQPASGSRKPRKTVLDIVQQLFDRALEWAFQHRALTVLGGVASLGVAVLMAANTPQVLFPTVDRDQFAVEIYLPNGRSLAETDGLVAQVEADLLADARVVDVTAFVGSGSPRFHTVYAPNMPSRNYAQLIVNTKSNQSTIDVLGEFAGRYENEVAEGYVRWKQIDLSLSRAPIEVRLIGGDPETVAGAAAWLKTEVLKIPGVAWTRDDHEEPLPSIEVVPDADAAAQLGLSPAMLRTSLALGTQGIPVTTIWEGDYPVQVLVEEQEGERTTLEGLNRQQVSSLWLGASVPLAQVARLRPRWHAGALIRRNGRPTTTVRVDVGMGVLASEVQAEVEDIVNRRGAIPGVEIEYGGEKEASVDGYAQLAAALATSVASIYLLLLIQFRRHSLALLVMATMPLSLLGAVVGLWATGSAFGFTSFVGLISLMGIVVRNGIILVDYAEQLRAQGRSAREAGLEAGKRRMRPIYLTAVAAAVGTLPPILSGSLLWSPLASVICFGLIASMILTLLVLPVAYSLVAPRRRPTASQGGGPVVATAAAFLFVLLVSPTHALAGEGPYTLADCLALSRKNSSEVRMAKAEVKAAEDTKTAAFTHYLPQISATAGAVVAKDPFGSIDIQGGNLPVYDGNPLNLPTASQFAYMPGISMGVGNKALVMGLTAVQPLYAGGRIVTGNRLAQVGVDAARDNVERIERDAQALTEEKYWRLVGLKEKRRTLSAFEALLGALAKQVGDAVHAGLVTRNDELKVKLQQNQAAVDRVRLESGIALASSDFRRHLGLPAGSSIALADALGAPRDPTPLRSYIKGAEDRRVEIRLLEHAARAEALKTDMKLGEGLPTLSVGASAYRSHVEGVPASGNAMVFGVVSVPLTGFVTGWYDAASQRKRTAVARQKVADTRELIGLGATSTWNDLWVAWQMTTHAELVREQAETNLTEVNDRYQNGLVPFSDLLEAEVLRQQARDKQLDARSEFWLKRSAFLRDVGRSSGSPRGQGPRRRAP